MARITEVTGEPKEKFWLEQRIGWPFSGVMLTAPGGGCTRFRGTRFTSAEKIVTHYCRRWAERQSSIVGFVLVFIFPNLSTYPDKL